MKIHTRSFSIFSTIHLQLPGIVCDFCFSLIIFLKKFQDGEDHEPSSYLQKFSRQFSRHDSEFSHFSRQFSRHDSEFSHQIRHLLDDEHNKQSNGTRIPDIVLTEEGQEQNR